MYKDIYGTISSSKKHNIFTTILCNDHLSCHLSGNGKKFEAIEDEFPTEHAKEAWLYVLQLHHPYFNGLKDKRSFNQSQFNKTKAG